MSQKTIGIVGAGPGGLTAGMLLAHRGYQVDIYEKSDRVGGRNACLEQDGFKFDIGPTFLMLKPVLEEMFSDAGEDIQQYLKFYELDPMYRLVFKDKELDLSPDHEKTCREIAVKFPGEQKGFNKLLKKEALRFKAAFPCLQKDYSGFLKIFNKDLIKFLPKLSFPNSMHDELGKYFKDEDLKMAFTFQSKYLGMSPWECPAAFMIIPFIEHNFGIQHVRGGLSEISEAMKKVFLKNGGRLHLNTPVSSINDTTLKLANGETVISDRVIINADVGYAMKNLLKNKDLSDKAFSCSTFMLYLGIDEKLDWAHHAIYFSDDYQGYVNSIFKQKELNRDISFYIRNASPIDDSLAPEGMSNIYVLVPVPNNKSKIDWQKEKSAFRDLVLDKIKQKTGFNLADHIKTEIVITPQDWEKDYNVFLGATFNLAHSLNQMLYFRPHNNLGKNQYLVGGGTNPGSGLPTIYESGRITANIILNQDK